MIRQEPELAVRQAPRREVDVPGHSERRDLEARTRSSISARITSGRIRKGAVARELGLSPRSLDRELARCGTCFRHLLDGLRRELAERRLAETGMTLAEVSRSLGYANPANFTRAFYRWTGESPRCYRKRVGAK